MNSCDCENRKKQLIYYTEELRRNKFNLEKNMTKEILVKIRGLQFAGEDDSDSMEVITSGTYYKKNEKHYVLYEEVMEGTDEITKNMIKIGNDFMEVTRKGPAATHLIFEKDKKNISNYYTPYGNFLIGIDTKEMSVNETDFEMNVKVNYGLEINYEHMADCNIMIDIKSKTAKDFRI